MAVWGWAPELFVQTGLRPGTRDPNTHFQIQPSALQGYYRARYLADLSRRRPEFFVDAVAPNRFGYQVRALNGFETFPELARLIASEYRLVAEVDGVRIYQRIEPRAVGSS